MIRILLCIPGAAVVPENLHLAASRLLVLLLLLLCHRLQPETLRIVRTASYYDN